MICTAKKFHLLITIISIPPLVLCSCDSAKKWEEELTGNPSIKIPGWEREPKASPKGKQPTTIGPVTIEDGTITDVDVEELVDIVFHVIKNYEERRGTREEVAKAEERVETKEPTQIEEKVIKDDNAKYAEKIGEKDGKVEVVIVDPKTNKSVDNKVYEIPKEEIDKLDEIQAQAPPDKPQLEDQIPTQSKTDTKPIEPVPPEQPPVTPPTTSEVEEPQPTAPDESEQPVVAKEDTETTGTEEGPKQERVKFGKLGSHNVIFRL